MNGQYMTAEELADMFRVPTSYVEEQARMRRWPHALIARKYRFSPRDVAEIEAMLRREPLPPVPAAPNRVEAAPPSRAPAPAALRPRRTAATAATGGVVRLSARPSRRHLRLSP